MRRSQGLRLAFDRRLPAVGGMNTEDHFRGLGASGSQQPRQADDLARADMQIERGDGAFFAIAFKGSHRFITQ